MDKAFFGIRIMRKVAELTAAYDEFRKNDLTRMNEKELIGSYEELRQLNSDAAYYNIVTPLLLHFYNWSLKSSASKHAVDVVAFDIAADIDELREYDPTDSLRAMGDKFASLVPEARGAITDHKASGPPSEEVESLREEISSFLRKFGHLSDSGNDFSAPPWRENPDWVQRSGSYYPMMLLVNPPSCRLLRRGWNPDSYLFEYNLIIFELLEN